MNIILNMNIQSNVNLTGIILMEMWRKSKINLKLVWGD